MPHRTTRHGGTGSFHAPWLVSMAMWFNCMKHVDEKGITVKELVRQARTHTNLGGMLRWGYIVEDGAKKRRGMQPHPDAVIRVTPAGQKAREVWRPLFEVVEQRWRERFGERNVERLREALSGVARQFDAGLPDCLPILHYGLVSPAPEPDARKERAADEDLARLELPALLARVLLAFALEFECESDISLAISANVLRVLDEKGVRARDIPTLAGVSKESVSIAMGILRKMRLAIEGADPSGGRSKVVRLTEKGHAAQRAYLKLVAEIEERWQSHYGKKEIGALCESLERIVGDPAAHSSPLFRGIEPHRDGWRASVPKPKALPHYPMVSHRGGFPDGS